MRELNALKNSMVVCVVIQIKNPQASRAREDWENLFTTERQKKFNFLLRIKANLLQNISRPETHLLTLTNINFNNILEE